MPGRIKQSDIDTVLERTDIVQLVNEYVPLKKSGREFRGPCPFHQEKDPSFYVNPAKGVYFCFGCKASGSVVQFVQQIEGLQFVEAIEKLADRIGYQLTYEASSEADVKGRLERDRLYELNQTAADYYHYLLNDAKAGGAAREYLKGRGFGKEIAGEFLLGFAPAGWENLSGFLAKKGYSPAEMVTVGLARERAGAEAKGVYDIFRNRVIFPILDHRGKVVAFGGRRMEGESSDEPKYLNSPETPVYRKGRTLYGFYQARTHIQDSGQAVVVEGYTDMLALWQAGVRDAVASLGTALTENHFDILNRFCEKVYLAFDADRAGVDAARRVLEFWGRFRIDVFVVNLPQGEDPASLVEKEGAEAFREAIAGAEGLLEFSVRKIIEGCDTNTTMGRRRAMEACMPVLAKVSAEEMRPLRNELVRDIGGRLDMPVETVEFYLREASRAAPRGGAREEERATAMWEKVEREALRVLLHDPEALVEQQYMDPDYFADGINKKIFEMLKELAVRDEENIQAGYDSCIRRMVEGIEDEALRGKTIELLMEQSPPQGEEALVFDRLRYLFFRRLKRQRELELTRLNKKLEPKKYEAICSQLLEIDQVIKEEFPYDHG